ncbi:C4b-binding protein alpha chain isoform X2 [Bubalus kerabau]|uniref:C4b-binding protein alpha chain isoform X2 n=1 Tax=Bubalus carabanensis TaxID=3119969 RepID=UPI00244EE13E|nr:C4b-binding protein alpha chain isoform X2 [Bubalus carabanensis]
MCRKVSMKHQQVPVTILHSKGTMASWPFSRLWSISDPILFQVTLVATLLATVLGSCDTPPYLDFAYPINELNETTFETGTTLKYICRPGYRISSRKNFLTCDGTDNWKYKEFCVKKRCENPGELLNGQVIVKTDYSFGSEIEFSCSEGYILIGSANSYCELQDTAVVWSDPLPQCIIAKCEPPPTISNGRHNGGDEDFYTYGSSVTYSCDHDFSMLGKASISCRVENKTIGVWSPSPPSCKNGCLGLPHIPHASWGRYDYQTQTEQEVYDIGTVLSYKCQFGYKPETDGPTTVTCQSNLKWSPYIECKEVCCPEPNLNNYGSITLQRRLSTSTHCTYISGDKVSYECHNKYMIDATCTKHGTWSPRTPECRPDCESPPVIAHGQRKIVSKLFAFEHQAVYECDEGYILVGAKELSCTFSGWSPAVPQCKALCLKPDIEYGRLSVEKVRYVEPERITIQCESGYSLVGSENITCSEDRTWRPEVPKCEWEYSEGCEQVVTGRKLLQCLSRPEEVKLALEVYKLSLEIELLQTNKLKNFSQEAFLLREREKNVTCDFNPK